MRIIRIYICTVDIIVEEINGEMNDVIPASIFISTKRRRKSMKIENNNHYYALATIMHLPAYIEKQSIKNINKYIIVDRRTKTWCYTERWCP